MRVGDYIQNFSLPDQAGKAVTPAEFVGRGLVLFFYLSDASPGCAKEACGFRDLHADFAGIGVAVVGVGVDSVASHKTFADLNNLPFPILSDDGAKLAARCGVLREELVDGKPEVSLSRTTLLFAPNFRVVKTYTDVESPNHAADVYADAKKILTREAPRQIVGHAPVLLVPNVLSPDLCKELIALWESDNTDSGFMKQVDGKTVGMLDYQHKQRRDHFLKPGPVQARLQEDIANRLTPEIAKTSCYQVSRREDFRVACYDASRGGYFRPHRDNTTEGTAHRRFAMSLLLNDEYEGGFLRFPEYAPHTYRPDAGSAVIFSCSLLHEATDVTAGRRFVLLSFFYGEAEAKIREEYSRKVGAQYRA